MFGAIERPTRYDRDGRLQKTLNFTKQKHFEHATKAGRYLAYCLRKEAERKSITGIKTQFPVQNKIYMTNLCAFLQSCRRKQA